MSSPPTKPAGELEDELASFRAAWLAETRRTKPPAASSTSATSTASRPPRPAPAPAAAAPLKPSALTDQQDTSPDANAELAAQVVDVQLDDQLEAPTSPPRDKGKGKAKERERPSSALELYALAVESEKQGRLNDGAFPSPSHSLPLPQESLSGALR